nr:hypothetical protein [Tanacetum cinerariifolium]
MTRDRSQLTNFVHKFLGTIKFGNDHIAMIMRYDDYQIGNVTISRVYYVEGPRHNLFSVGQFCDSDLEVAFRKHTCFVNNLEASKIKSWLWHRRLSHLNFGAINHLAKHGLIRDYEVFYDDHVKEISSGSTTTHSDFSLYDSFIFDLLINPFLPVDRSDFYEFADELTHIISPPEYDCFCFKNEPNSGDFTIDVAEDTFPTREPRVHNALPTHPTLQLNLDFILSSESVFAYVVWIFLLFLSYSVAPKYLLSFGNEDTIFDPDISSYHISSFMSNASHRSGTFIKFNVIQNT